MDFSNFGKATHQLLFDSEPKGHTRERASSTSSLKSDFDNVLIGNFDENDLAAMASGVILDLGKGGDNGFKERPGSTRRRRGSAPESPEEAVHRLLIRRGRNPHAKTPSARRSVTEGVWCDNAALVGFVGIDADSPLPFGTFEFDLAIDQGEQRMIAAHPDVHPGVKLGAALSDDDVARSDDFAAVSLDA